MTKGAAQIKKIYIIEDKSDVYDMENFNFIFNKAWQSRHIENSLENFFLERFYNYKTCPIASEEYLLNETKGDPDIHKKWTELWYKDSLVNQINKLEFEDTSFFSEYGLELEEPSYSDTKQGFNEAKEEIIKLIWKE